MTNAILNKFKLFGACAVLAASCVPAQSGSKVIATVPFDFTVAHQRFAAGPYTMIVEAGRAAMFIRGREDTRLVLTNSAETLRISAHAKLVFNRYGDRYFLAEVWPAGTARGRKLSPSKAELELARNGGRPEVVSLLVTPGRSVVH